MKDNRPQILFSEGFVSEIQKVFAPFQFGGNAFLWNGFTVQKYCLKLMPGFLVLMVLFGYKTTYGQFISGSVLDFDTRQSIEFVNVGIAGKNVGTVTDSYGRFHFSVGAEFNGESILFSMVGYEPKQFKVSSLRKRRYNLIYLKKKDYKISEVKILPRTFERKILGVTSKDKKVVAGFKNNLLGYEYGVLMKAPKTAIVKQINMNISHCSYDTILYRLNVYSVLGDMKFENVLREPIYIEMSKDLLKDEISIDLESKDIIVVGDFLITLEHIKDLGEGSLYFCTEEGPLTYFRKTSQGDWEAGPIGISISAVVDLEK